MTELRNYGKRNDGITELQEGGAQASRQAVTEKGITKRGNRFHISVIPFFRNSVIPFFRHSRAGAVKMEYVIIAVLIAAACVVAVMALGRAITRGWMISATGTAGQGSRAGEMGKAAGNKAVEEAQIGENYNELFHD